MKNLLKRGVRRLADTRLIRAIVNHLIYPSIVRALRAEVMADTPSPSRVVESIAWKTHANIVAWEELTGGVVCYDGESSSSIASRARLFDAVCARVEAQAGDIFEFGVSSGESFLEFLRRCPGRQVYGFDSFEGLPEAWWTRPKGAFVADAPRFDNPNGHLVAGWFESSVPAFFADWNGSIALLHVDCDLYSSTSIALRHALKFCRLGSIVLFDEYYNYPGFAEHEWLAWRQMRHEFGIRCHCLGYDGRRAAFVIDVIMPRHLDV